MCERFLFPYVDNNYRKYFEMMRLGADFLTNIFI